MEGKTNFSRRLKQLDGLTRLTPTAHILRQIYAAARYKYCTSTRVCICPQMHAVYTHTHTRARAQHGHISPTRSRAYIEPAVCLCI